MDEGAEKEGWEGCMAIMGEGLRTIEWRGSCRWEKVAVIQTGWRWSGTLRER